MQRDITQDKAAQSAGGAAEGQPLPALREIEIKFRAREGGLGAALASPIFKDASLSKPQELIAVHFDTSKNDLKRQGITLRVRKTGGSPPVLGVKWAGLAGEGGVFGRGEIEVRCSDGEPDLNLFEPETRERLTNAVGGEPLERRFETLVTRWTAYLRHGLSDIEAAFDDGTIAIGAAMLPLTEVELELKAGAESDLIDLAMKLVQDQPLRLDFMSKPERGYLLAAGKRPKPHKARPIEMAPGESLDGAVSAVIAGTLAHFVSNWAPLRDADDPEAIHQLRVALRRMRSALGSFQRKLPSGEIEELRAEAKRIATAFGPARDCDVFLGNARAGPLKDPAAMPKGAEDLLQLAENGRSKHYAAARQLIEEKDTSLFVLKVQSFLARRAWRNALTGGDLPNLSQPASGFARESLQHLHKRAMKRGKHLPDIRDEERHQLRIALKNFRYAAEFFGALFDRGRRLGDMLESVAFLQDILGAHNDTVAARQFMERLEIPAADPAILASGYLLGWYQHASIVADAHLTKTWKAFRRCKPFWK